MRKSELERVQLLADVGLLTPSIIHDIRSYLTAIKGNAQIGEKLSNDPNSSERFRKIVELVDRATDMIESFRKFYKGESEKERFVLADILNFAVSLLREKLAGIDIDIKGADVFIDGNKSLLTQVFINLLSNSADALLNSDKKIIRIWVEKIENKKSKLRIFVGDSGSGIPPKIRKKIFKPFFTTKDKGTGLGLFIVKRILERSGGRIKLLDKIEMKKIQKKENLNDLNTIFMLELSYGKGADSR